MEGSVDGAVARPPLRRQRADEERSPPGRSDRVASAAGAVAGAGGSLRRGTAACSTRCLGDRASAGDVGDGGERWAPRKLCASRVWRRASFVARHDRTATCRSRCRSAVDRLEGAKLPEREATLEADASGARLLHARRRRRGVRARGEEEVERVAQQRRSSTTGRGVQPTDKRTRARMPTGSAVAMGRSSISVSTPTTHVCYAPSRLLAPATYGEEVSDPET